MPVYVTYTGHLLLSKYQFLMLMEAINMKDESITIQSIIDTLTAQDIIDMPESYLEALVYLNNLKL